MYLEKLSLHRNAALVSNINEICINHFWPLPQENNLFWPQFVQDVHKISQCYKSCFAWEEPLVIKLLPWLTSFRVLHDSLFTRNREINCTSGIVADRKLPFVTLVVHETTRAISSWGFLYFGGTKPITYICQNYFCQIALLVVMDCCWETEVYMSICVYFINLYFQVPKCTGS